MKILFIIILFYQFVYSQNSSGNRNGFELGDAMYRTSKASPYNNHGHAGIFGGFTTDNGNYQILLMQTSGYASGLFGIPNIWSGNNQILKSNKLGLNNGIFNLQLALDDLFIPKKSKDENAFLYDYGNTYLGTTSVASMTPTQRNLVVSYATSIVNEDPGYTFEDIIDPKNHFYNWWWRHTWDGTVSDIDEIRCDGYVEYPYEKAGVMVSGWRNIGDAGNANVDYHNDLHNGDAQSSELCPMIQANIDYDGTYNGGMSSTMQPTVVEPPSITNLNLEKKSVTKWLHVLNSYTICDDPIDDPIDPREKGPTDPNCKTYHYYTYESSGTVSGVQLSFEVSDNASIKSFILIQAKIKGQSTWYTLRNGANDWNFKENALTDWNGHHQKGYIFVPWDGRTKNESKVFSQNEMLNAEYKVIAIDQGGNKTSKTFWVPTAPTNLNSSYTGKAIIYTWTDNATNENNYIFEYKKPGAGWSSLSLAANSTSYLLNINSVGSYFARVRAKVVTSGETILSAYSNTNARTVPNFLSLSGPTQINFGSGTWTVLPTGAESYIWSALVTSMVQTGTRKWVDDDGIIHYDPIYEERERTINQNNTSNSFTFSPSSDDNQIKVTVKVIKNGLTESISRNCYFNNDLFPKKDSDNINDVLAISKNYPNPFNPVTTIKYSLNESVNVRITIYNSLGQTVETLVNTYQHAGKYYVKWNAENFASGIYFYRFQAGKYDYSEKMILMK
jgi:flagellar hook assembly protein FlgD